MSTNKGIFAFLNDTDNLKYSKSVSLFKMDNNKLFYAVGVVLIILGAAFLTIWNIKWLGYVLAVGGIIVAGLARILSE